MRILLLGDIVGVRGRRLVTSQLPALKREMQADICIANAENVCEGSGIDATSAKKLLQAGVDYITLGNHIWSKHSWLKDCEDFPMIARPLNAPAEWPGFDHVVAEMGDTRLLLISLLGQTYMQVAHNPFVVMEQTLEALKQRYKSKIVIVDFHAEATAEKIAMGHFLQDRVSVVFGTHTHVQTADECVLGSGTAYITDLGMTGPANGVIGMAKTVALRRFLEQLPARYEVEAEGPLTLQGAIVDINSKSGQAQAIERIRLNYQDN